MAKKSPSDSEKVIATIEKAMPNEDYQVNNLHNPSVENPIFAGSSVNVYLPSSMLKPTHPPPSQLSGLGPRPPPQRHTSKTSIAQAQRPLSIRAHHQQRACELARESARRLCSDHLRHLHILSACADSQARILGIGRSE